MTSLISSKLHYGEKTSISTVTRAVKRHLMPLRVLDPSLLETTPDDIKAYANEAALWNSPCSSHSVEAGAPIPKGLNEASDSEVAQETNGSKHFGRFVRVSRRRTDLLSQKPSDWRCFPASGEPVSSVSAVCSKEAANTDADGFDETSEKSGEVSAAGNTKERTGKGRVREGGKRPYKRRKPKGGDEGLQKQESTTLPAASSSVEIKQKRSKLKRSRDEDANSDLIKEQSAAVDDEMDLLNQAPKGRKKRKKKLSLLICPQCKLSQVEWPFCGITGNPHTVEDV
ncbi:unnamed protein product [Phytomonas sp. EM1]|nr:unnamed protein product [Phytomonas sp. EM1]|eukprot:CCW62547.1 unnamed protein product [Phytomonas sp. isolate EM1]